MAFIKKGRITGHSVTQKVAKPYPCGCGVSVIVAQDD